MMTRIRRVVRWLAALAGAVGLVVFWPCVRNGFTHWDDPEYLDRVVELQGISLQSVHWAFVQSVAVAGYYHPLTWLSHLLDYQLWGLQPLPYHATNLLLHVLNIVLVVVFVEKLLRAVPSLADNERYAMTLSVGIVFAIHPLQVEVVAWIAERKTLLCATFILASLCAYMKLAEGPSRRGWWWAMNTCFALALLAKPMAVPLPAVMLLLDWYPLRRPATWGWWRLLREKLPMFLLGMLSAAGTFFTQSRQGAIDTFAHLGAAERGLVAARSLVFYVWKLVWPMWLSPYYPMSESVSARDVEYLVPGLICVALAVIAFAGRRRWPSLGTALAANAVFLAPVSGLVPLGGYAVADRYAYLAMVPILLLVAGAVVLLWRRPSRLARAVLVIWLCCQFLLYVSATRGQIRVWSSDETLWREVWSHFPNSPVANCQLAMAYKDRSRFEEGLAYAVRAIELSPDFAEAHAAAGVADLKLRRYRDAVTELSHAIRDKPTLLAARYNLACADARLGRLGEAYDALRELLAAQPGYAPLAARDGELAALRHDPDYAARFAALTGAAKN